MCTRLAKKTKMDRPSPLENVDTYPSGDDGLYQALADIERSQSFFIEHFDELREEDQQNTLEFTKELVSATVDKLTTLVDKLGQDVYGPWSRKEKLPPRYTGMQNYPSGISGVGQAMDDNNRRASFFREYPEKNKFGILKSTIAVNKAALAKLKSMYTRLDDIVKKQIELMSDAQTTDLLYSVHLVLTRAIDRISLVTFPVVPR
jgi:hypothetical protein